MGRTTRVALMSLALATIASSAFAAGGPVAVAFGDSKRITLPGAAKSVVIGNSKVADATLVDAHSVIITAHGYGQTNVMAFDQQGQVLLDSPVFVISPASAQVTYYAGGVATNFTCAPRCEKVEGDGGNAGGGSSAEKEKASQTIIFKTETGN